MTKPRLRVVGTTIVDRTVRPRRRKKGLANVAQIRAQVPLPETADELCEVARHLEHNDIRLGVIGDGGGGQTSE